MQGPQPGFGVQSLSAGYGKISEAKTDAAQAPKNNSRDWE